MTGSEDIRLAFVGDSFVAGVGDPDYLGWAGRVAQAAGRRGAAPTVYNLGIRRDTSADVLARFASEVGCRIAPGAKMGVVVSVGVNDCTLDGEGTRVALTDSDANLAMIIATAGELNVPLLVVGSPPVAEDPHNDRIAKLDERYSATCRATATTFISVFGQLRASATWMDEVRSGDGAHPGAAGYRVLTDLVIEPWWQWLRGAV